MRAITLIGEDGNPVCELCAVADKPLSRLRGLLGSKELSEGQGMLLQPCRSIHTSFLRYPIDAVFLDRQLRVVDVVSGLKPWRAVVRFKAAAVLELPSGAARGAGIRKGDRLAWGMADNGVAA